MKTILAVDDSPSIRMMVALTVRQAGFAVVEAKDGVDALAKAHENTFDLVLTDQNMPNMDGLTLIAHLRSLPQYRVTPIVVLTTESDAEIKLRGKEASASAWVVKPFSPEGLLDVIHRLIRS